MRKYLLPILVALLPALAQAEPSCEKNPIYCDIVKLKPRVDRKLASLLSNSIAKYSKQFGTDPSLSVAIAMQESSFVNKNRMGTILVRGHLVHGVTDVGVFQIHVQTIANLQDAGADLDVDRLAIDVDYQTYWHVKILKSKISTCTSQRDRLKVLEGNEWSCYHSFTPDKRKIYLRMIGRHLTKLNF